MSQRASNIPANNTRVSNTSVRESIIDGGVQFCVEVKKSDFDKWPAERITLFFDGIAKVMEAMKEPK